MTLRLPLLLSLLLAAPVAQATVFPGKKTTGQQVTANDWNGIVDRGEGVVNVAEYLPAGFVRDGSVNYYTQVAALVTAQGATPGTLVVPFPVRVNTNLSIPSTFPVRFEGTGAWLGSGVVTYTPWASGALVTASGGTTPRSLAARAADVVNVLDYGAVGNGVADDTAAIQASWAAAIAAGKPMYLPDGRYSVTPGQLVATEQAGLRIYGAGARRSVLVARSGTSAAMLTLKNVRDSQFSDFGIEGWTAAPIPFAIELVSQTTVTYISTNNLFERMRIGGDAVGLVDGIGITATLDHNNDLHQFKNITFVNESGAGISVEHSNAISQRITDCTFGPVATAVRVKAGSANINGGWVYATSVDFDIGATASTQFHPTTISNVHSESNARVLYVAAASTGVMVHLSGYDRQGGVASSNIIDFRSPSGYLLVTGGRFNIGQTGAAISVTGASSVADFIGNTALGFDTLTFSGTLKSINNHWIPGTVTESMGTKFYQAGDTGAQYTANQVRDESKSAATTAAIRLSSTSGTNPGIWLGGQAGSAPSNATASILWDDGTKATIINAPSGGSVTLRYANVVKLYVDTDGLHIGTTASAPLIASGTGAPSSDWPLGSLWLRTDGSTSTTLYVKTAAGGGGWTAK